MTPETIQEKLRRPSLPATYLQRPRLERIWQERSQNRLLLVTAGAGYGKSSFLADRARDESRSVLWFWIDSGDARFPTFAAHLLELLGRVPSPAVGEAHPQQVLAAAVSALRARGPTLLVLDDAHLLRSSPEALQFLEALARLAPETTTLVVSGREPLAIGGTRARTSGRAASIDAPDLSFRADEIAALFALRLDGATLSTSQCRRILTATEGWAAGIEILLQSLDGPSPSAIERTLERLAAAGSGWFDYFAEEVVARLDERTRGFLCRAAVLPHLDPATCDHLLRRSDSRAVLEELVHRNLFTLRDAPDGQRYRFHHLFHRFLRDWQEQQLPSEEILRLRQRAARAWLRSGDAAGALELFAAAGDIKTSLALLARRGEGLLAAGRHTAVESALAVLPLALRRRNADVLFVQARLHDDFGRWDEAEAAYRRVLKLRPGKARRVEVLSSLGQLISRRGEYGPALALCHRGLRERKSASTQAQGRLLWTLGVAACELGRLDEGRKRLEEARALFVRRKDRSGEAQVDYLLAANVHLARGEFALGRETARRALLRLRSLENPRRVSQCLGVLAWVSALAGDVAEARDQATEARRMAGSLGLPQVASMALHVLGRCDLLDQDLDQARRRLDEARELGDSLGESDARIMPRLLLGECALASGDRGDARRMGEEALAIAREAKDVLQEAQARVLLGLAAPGSSRAAARDHWTRAERTFRRLGAAFDLHRLLLLRLAEERLPDAARRRLARELMTSTERCGHDRLFLVTERSRAARVLARALVHGIQPARVRDLLARLGEPAVPEILPLCRDPRDGVRLQAVELLAQIGGTPARAALAELASGDTTRPSVRRAEEELERAPRHPLGLTTLGGLRVCVGAQPVPAERWRSARGRRLFQFLLVHRFRWVTGDEVIEGLWPDADPEKARGNLWQSVHRLRRILEPELKQLRASCYVRVADAGYRLEPGDGHSYDVLEFEESIREADRRVSSRPRAAERLYRRALELYAGDFLPEDPYEEFLLPQRERLREMSLRAALRLVGICAAGRRWNESIPLCRRALTDDPYNEDLHFHLVEAQIRLGRRREALEAYRQFEAKTISELGLLPSARMQELAERIGRGAAADLPAAGTES